MILYPPIKFNENEWFILIAIAIILFLLFIMPKRIPFAHAVSYWVFNLYLALTIDYCALLLPIHLYFSNDRDKYEIFDFLLYYFLYPGSMYLFISGLATWQFLRKHGFYYVCCAAIVTTVLEKIAHFMKVFTYIHWSIWLSLIAYIILYSMNVGMYYFVGNQSKLFRKLKKTNEFYKPN